MVALFRVLPYLASARAGEPGHPLYVPPSTGAGRVDNPGRYGVLYVGDAAAGAVAEAFGWMPEWSALMLRGRPALAGSVRLSLIHISEPTRLGMISYAVFCLKKK